MILLFVLAIKCRVNYQSKQTNKKATTKKLKQKKLCSAILVNKQDSSLVIKRALVNSLVDVLREHYFLRQALPESDRTSPLNVNEFQEEEHRNLCYI